MSWGEAGRLPDSKNLVRGHMQVHVELIESWGYCPVTGLQPAEPLQQLISRVTVQTHLTSMNSTTLPQEKKKFLIYNK